MKLEDWQGKTLIINCLPRTNLTKEGLAEKIAEDFKSYSISHKPHRVAMAKWMLALIEDQMALFLDQIQNGLREQHAPKPHLTPRQLRREGGKTIIQMGPGAPWAIEDKRD